MTKTDKDTPSDTRLRLEQAARLRRLRVLLGYAAQDAAAQAGLSRFAWARMEDGDRRIDTVALGRFLAGRGLPAEYVVSGSLSGLPLELQRDLVAAEVDEKAAAAGGSGSPSATLPASTRTRRSKVSSGK